MVDLNQKAKLDQRLTYLGVKIGILMFFGSKNSINSQSELNFQFYFQNTNS